MSTISVRLNEVELEELEEIVRMASSSIKVSRHQVMKHALSRGLQCIKDEVGSKEIE